GGPSVDATVRAAGLGAAAAGAAGAAASPGLGSTAITPRPARVLLPLLVFLVARQGHVHAPALVRHLRLPARW
ncbi:hypothetical protein, partial [Acidisphaera rubrifaciens]|uniref:hypothetical protein n=1 Tax=Acidisphaera rubrifaciens TaxID=50715 RepID=UPI00066278C3